ncbi:biopolymer transport protein TolR [Serratia symbiotica str. 'Cinara cedri']|nr:biopolymer transport protein TolR [Serratia symbiotica str. 'Cinara cedri']
MISRMPGRHRLKLTSEINIVPLLDVLLVLVLIFMATVPVITQSVEVDLPSAANSHIVFSTDNMPVILEVSRIGQYTLVINHKRMVLLPSDHMTALVKLRLIVNPKTIFLIGGAKDVPYDEIIKALNILHQLGARSIGLMTKPI